MYALCFLLRVCYERCPINPTAATFLLSAMWHGVYPGYYLTFLTGIGMTMAARAVSTRRAHCSIDEKLLNLYITYFQKTCIKILLQKLICLPLPY